MAHELVAVLRNDCVMWVGVSTNTLGSLNICATFENWVQDSGLQHVQQHQRLGRGFELIPAGNSGQHWADGPNKIYTLAGTSGRIQSAVH